MGLAIVLAMRLAVPLTILRWPLGGTLLSIAADTVDIVIYNIVGYPGVGTYQEIDKALDLWYATLNVVVVQRWEALPRATASALFAYRLVGVTLFEITGTRVLLLAFPNVFELFYLAELAMRRWYRACPLGAWQTAMLVAALTAPKLLQEYLLHDARVLDDYVLKDVVRNVINGLRGR